MPNSPAEPTTSEEKQFKDNVKDLTHKLDKLTKYLSPAFLIVVGLAFFGQLPFYTVAAFMMALLGLAFYLIYRQIKCPRCSASPFSPAGFKAHPFCHNCGLRIDERKTVTEEMAEKYPDENLADLEWEPLNIGTANFDNHRLIQTKVGHLAFRATKGAIVFSWVFILVGLVSAYFLGDRIPPQAALLSEEVLILLIPLVFSLAGFIMLYFALRLKEFNLSDGVYKSGKEQTLLMQIKGLQLLSHQVSSNDSHYTNYQLNLVLQEQNRLAVVSYANKDNAIRDAERLASYLGVKLWQKV